jgi:hypothetical protein
MVIRQLKSGETTIRWDRYFQSGDIVMRKDINNKYNAIQIFNLNIIILF